MQLDKLLKTEMVSHTRNWKLRKKIFDELLHAKISIEQEINVITDETLDEIIDDNDIIIDEKSL